VRVTIPTRPVVFALVLALVLGLVVWAVLRGGDAFSPSRPIRVATWNMQWLVSPETARRARLACRDGQASPLPCDVARGQVRDSADLGALAGEVRRLGADVIAFQEVEDANVARRVFRGYDICIAPGAGAQHAGFAVRRWLDARCEPPLDSLAAGGRGRSGQVLLLRVPGGPPWRLLSVHLKSGCAHDPLESATGACRLLARQAAALGEWIAARVTAQEPFIVLGDLNRAGTPGSGDPFWDLLDASTFETSAAHLPFRNCVFGEPYETFIDHILVDRALMPHLHPEGFMQMRFPISKSIRFRLPDHCPVRVSLTARAAL
jgi:endonuclease/exonuclease/phosphatase family metal-dependent hydrolase